MGNHEFSTDPQRLQAQSLQALLHEHCWAKGIPVETLWGSISSSHCVGAYVGSEQVGFARVVNMGTPLAYLCDVCVLPGFRHQGLARQMLATLLSTFGSLDVRAWLRTTRKQRQLYRRLGFNPLPLCCLRRRPQQAPSMLRNRPSRCPAHRSGATRRPHRAEAMQRAGSLRATPFATRPGLRIPVPRGHHPTQENHEKTPDRGGCGCPAAAEHRSRRRCVERVDLERADPERADPERADPERHGGQTAFV